MDPTRFMHTFVAGWADMDWNRHMANTAYLDKAVDARVHALGRMGLTMDTFVRLGIGVVVMADEVQYRREVTWMEEIGIDFALAGLADDASRFKVRNRIFRGANGGGRGGDGGGHGSGDGGGHGGELCATVTSTGGFIDLATRALVAPPPAIAAAYRALPKTEDYETLPSSLRACRVPPAALAPAALAEARAGQVA